ncbi:dGTPase [Sphingomonas endophytica]|uniref:dGTPase n=1 Tax=Sphingomonas endophytica TaxID=869719 RepID=A0A7X0MNP9_9SPHN|nr:dNTP triphosphohydrolase [Sphingomonas endophytica]MBB6503703.1 dGTPase [Sphingomonas endophytica]
MEKATSTRDSPHSPKAVASASPEGRTPDARLPFERDFDRLLFSAPVRRMADKTQVFPLEQHDSVRNRLTHSHEVSNLARSLGNDVVRNTPTLMTSRPEENAAIPVILGAVGLSHDVGNPPFGHQGEKAIGEWFSDRRQWIFDRQTVAEDAKHVDTAAPYSTEFTDFEGNAQSLRLLTKLQVSRDGYGLDLTLATLAASMKYTVGAKGVSTDKTSRTAANKKYGFFASEAQLFERVKTHTGLLDLRRHPLTWLMEAADDIAYSVLDVEDSIEKGLVSFREVKEMLHRQHEKGPADGKDPVIGRVLAALDNAVERVQARNISASEEDDVYVQILRASAISELVGAAGATFRSSWPAIALYEHTESIIESSAGAALAKALQDFAREKAFNNAGVLALELSGRRAVLDLMGWFWQGISQRENFNDPGSRRTNHFANLAYRRISENYRRVFENDEPRDGEGQRLSIRYRELRLLTDMISGMTDGYAMQTHAELGRIHAEYAGK